MMKTYAVAMAAVLMAVMLAGCAEDYAEAAPSAAPTASTAVETIEGDDVPIADTPAVTEPETTEGTEPADTDSSGTFQWPKLDKDAFRAARRTGRYADYTGASDEPDDVATETNSDFGSVEAIAALGGLTATVQEDKNECLVYIFDETRNHGNPYDVTWDYGKTYDSYVEAADWSLVFDAKYYKTTFPMLAVLYHNDDALLLKHFQTVGVHEGRQGSKGFNVAAYMDNCDGSLREAFGDNYECYYLYYLLHQDTESGVKATGAYKRQLAQELTVVQAKELKGVNWFREEVDAGTVEFDSEMAALANYRAYMDCTEGWDAHDGLDHMMDTGELDGYMDTLGMGVYCENKDTNGCYTGKEHVFSAVSDYRASKGHYETMVDPDYAYVGCSNFYVSDKDYNWSGELDNNVITFDTYANVVTTAYHTK